MPPLTQCSQINKDRGCDHRILCVCCLIPMKNPVIHFFLYVILFLFFLNLFWLHRVFTVARGRLTGVGVGLLVAGCRFRGLGQQKWCTGLAALQHVASSWTRCQICVSCIGKWIHNHFIREVPYDSFLSLTLKYPSSTHQLRKSNKLHGQSPL